MPMLDICIHMCHTKRVAERDALRRKGRLVLKNEETSDVLVKMEFPNKII